MSTKYRKTIAGIAAVLLLSGGLAGPAAAQDEALQERVQELQGRVRTLEVQVQTLIQLLGAQNAAGNVSVIQRSVAPGVVLPHVAVPSGNVRDGAFGVPQGAVLGPFGGTIRGGAPNVPGGVTLRGAEPQVQWRIAAPQAGFVRSFGPEGHGEVQIFRQGASISALRGGAVATLSRDGERIAATREEIDLDGIRTRVLNAIELSRQEGAIGAIRTWIDAGIDAGLSEEQAEAVRSLLTQIREIFAQGAEAEEQAEDQE